MPRSRSAERRRSRSRDRDRSRDRRRDRSRDRDRSRPRGGPSRRTEHEKISLLVRNIGDRTDGQELRELFGRYGTVKDVYIPIDYYTKRPKPFAFVEFINYEEAREAKEDMDRREFQGRVIDVVFAQQRRKTPDQMRTREGTSSRGGRYSRSPRRGHSPRRDRSRSPRRDRSRSPRKGSPPARRDSPRHSPRKEETQNGDEDRAASPQRAEEPRDEGNEEPIEA